MAEEGGSGQRDEVLSVGELATDAFLLAPSASQTGTLTSGLAQTWTTDGTTEIIHIKNNAGKQEFAMYNITYDYTSFITSPTSNGYIYYDGTKFVLGSGSAVGPFVQLTPASTQTGANISTQNTAGKTSTFADSAGHGYVQVSDSTTYSNMYLYGWSPNSNLVEGGVRVYVTNGSTSYKTLEVTGAGTGGSMTAGKVNVIGDVNGGFNVRDGSSNPYLTVLPGNATGTTVALTDAGNLTTGNIAAITCTATGLSSTTPTGLNVSFSGVNTNNSVTATGISVSVTNTGTTNTNTALKLTASGAAAGKNFGLDLTGDVKGNSIIVQSATPFLTTLGSGAGQSATGVDTTTIGYQAGNSITTGTDLTAVGYQAAKLSTGNSATAVGSGALVALTTGTHATAVGYQAGNAIVTGTDITAVGFQAAASATANFITSIGSGSLVSLTSGANNTAMGYQAGNTLLTGTDNVLIGYQAGKTITGSQNVYIGSITGNGPTSGSQNTVVGYQAASTNTNFSATVAIGYQAGNGGGNNTIVGTSAGSSITGGSNILVGFSAGNNITTGTNNVIVAYNTNAPAVGTTNYVNFGGFLVGYNATNKGISSFKPYLTNFSFQVTDSDNSNAIALALFGTGVSLSASTYVLSVQTLQIGSSTTSTNNQFSTASQGSNSTVMYIGNAAIATVSDSRLKTNIKPWIGSAMTTLRQANIVSFNWDDPSDRAPVNRNSRGTWVGMIAQETIDLMPWIVNAESRDCVDCRAGLRCAAHTSNWTSEYQYAVPFIIKALQEVDSEVESLKRRVGELETEVQRLKGG